MIVFTGLIRELFMNAIDSISQKDVSILSPLGHSLAATLYVPAQSPLGAILIGPATGIGREFYQHFATFLAHAGYGVLTFDNYGIGGSKASSVKHCDASLVTWGQGDLTAALYCLKEAFPDCGYHLVGHSAGGQLIGLMENNQLLTSVFNVACSSGQLSNMRLGYRLKAHYFMNAFIPLNNWLFGQTNSDWVGMGEKLPRLVASQWRRWCNGQGYVETGFGQEIGRHNYDTLSLPIHWVNAIDDDIANEKNVDDMIRVFPQCQHTKTILTPKDHQLSDIGHMRFFSRRSNALWPMVIQWINQY